MSESINTILETLTINVPSRTIFHSGPLLLGVKGDTNSERIQFSISQNVDEIGDLEEVSSNIGFNIYIDFENAAHSIYSSECERNDWNLYSENDLFTFDWILDQRVTIESGNVKFRVRIRLEESGGTYKEWHTGIFTGEVLDGIDIDDGTEQIVTPTSSIQELNDRMDEAINNYETEMTAQNDRFEDLIFNSIAGTLTPITDYDETIINSDVTHISGESLGNGDYLIIVDITSLGSTSDLNGIHKRYNYVGEHIFRGHVYPHQYTDVNMDASYNKASVLYSSDLVFGFEIDEYLPNGVSFGKLCLIVQNTSSGVKFCIACIQNPYSVPSYIYGRGTIKAIYKEAPGGGVVYANLNSTPWGSD